MPANELRHHNNDELHQYYLTTEMGAHVHRVTTDGSVVAEDLKPKPPPDGGRSPAPGVALYDIYNAYDRAMIAAGITLDEIKAWTSGIAPPIVAPVRA